MISYPARFTEDDDGWCVEFPDLEGCLTQGENLEEAKWMAQDALSLYLESLDSRKIYIPEPSNIQGDDIIYISPRLNVSFAITIKHQREKLGLTQKQVAEKAGIKWAFYQRIENPRRSNPTLATIEKVQNALGLSCF